MTINEMETQMGEREVKYSSESCKVYDRLTLIQVYKTRYNTCIYNYKPLHDIKQLGELYNAETYLKSHASDSIFDVGLFHMKPLI